MAVRVWVGWFFSRCWIIYWVTHGLYLLDAEPVHLYPAIIETLRHIQNPTGGFGGGPQQLSHCAPNYAAVLTLLTIGRHEAYDVIDRAAMYNFFLSMKVPSGGFMMHSDG
jgi:protein farnesyltransferase subunit beta